MILLLACAARDVPAPELGVGPTLDEILTLHWDGMMERSPLWATKLGDRRFDDQVGDNSANGHANRRAHRDWVVENSKAIPLQSLPQGDQITARLLIEKLEADQASDVCAFETWNLSARYNPVAHWNRFWEDLPLETEQDAENLVSRIQKIEENIRNEIDNLRVGLENGRVAPKETLRRTIAQVEGVVAKPMEASPLLTPIESFSPEWSPELATTMRGAIENQVLPAYGEYLTFLKEEALPKGRSQEQSGLVALPQGIECYNARIRNFTSLDRDAEQIHQLGLAEIERIDHEIAALGKELLDLDGLPEVLAALRSDRDLYFNTEDEVQEAAELALEAARLVMPEAFGILPEAGVEVRRIPEEEAPYTTIAYYDRAAADGPGYYYVNTWAPETRPRFEARVLAYHESIPGHHLQIAIAQEQEELPMFRRYTSYTAFVEGWALYTERLAEEMGLYPEPLDRMGMLSFDAWRAARLVVDTGIHAQGWSREQAEAYMLEHTALTPENIRNEVDRYISWPGQALAYKSGQLEILALRGQAEAALGDAFDLKAFHDVVLGSGAVSMPVLRMQVEDWIAEKRGIETD